MRSGPALHEYIHELIVLIRLDNLSNKLSSGTKARPATHLRGISYFHHDVRLHFSGDSKGGFIKPGDFSHHATLRQASPRLATPRHASSLLVQRRPGGWAGKHLNKLHAFALTGVGSIAALTTIPLSPLSGVGDGMPINHATIRDSFPPGGDEKMSEYRKIISVNMDTGAVLHVHWPTPGDGGSMTTNHGPHWTKVMRKPHPDAS